MQGNPGQTRPHSLNDRLADLEVGERVYIETSLENYKVIQSRAALASRRPACMKGMSFTSSLFTAVGSSAGDVRYLVCVERKT
jgi:protein gp37